MADIVTELGALLEDVVGFIDCAPRETCVPSKPAACKRKFNTDDVQALAYSGHYKKHGEKIQDIVFVDGMVIREVRLLAMHDSKVLTISAFSTHFLLALNRQLQMLVKHCAGLTCLRCACCTCRHALAPAPCMLQLQARSASNCGSARLHTAGLRGDSRTHGRMHAEPRMRHARGSRAWRVRTRLCTAACASCACIRI